jgi:hypothetical protein
MTYCIHVRGAKYSAQLQHISSQQLLAAPLLTAILLDLALGTECDIGQSAAYAPAMKLVMCSWTGKRRKSMGRCLRRA